MSDARRFSVPLDAQARCVEFVAREGPSFFERLFSGPPTPPANVGRRGQQQPSQRRVFTR